MPLGAPMLTRLSIIFRHLNPLARTMSTVHNTNKACCSIPPVQVDYTAKGTYKPHGAFDRVYVTGDKSETALVVIFDIFGWVNLKSLGYLLATNPSI